LPIRAQLRRSFFFFLLSVSLCDLIWFLFLDRLSHLEPSAFLFFFFAKMIRTHFFSQPQIKLSLFPLVGANSNPELSSFSRLPSGRWCSTSSYFPPPKRSNTFGFRCPPLHPLFTWSGGKGGSSGARSKNFFPSISIFSFEVR